VAENLVGYLLTLKEQIKDLDVGEIEDKN